jgi:hypothetical protein
LRWVPIVPGVSKALEVAQSSGDGVRVRTLVLPEPVLVAAFVSGRLRYRMALADQPCPESPEDSFIVERLPLDAARRRAGRQVPAAGAPWTACAAPGAFLVIDTDGSLFGCEFGSRPLAPPTAPLATWTRDDALELRRNLAGGKLPRSHCTACVSWISDDAYSSLPAIQDYGGLKAAVDPEFPSHLVVRLSAGRSTRPDLLAEVSPYVRRLQRLVIEVDEVQSSENGIGLIGELRAAETRPKLELRILKIGDPESFTALVQGLGEVDIELGLAEPDEDVLRSAREVAKAIGATLRARFVFTPANWFEFEEVVRACARHEVHLDLRVLDRGGKVPLSALDLAQPRVCEGHGGWCLAEMWWRCSPGVAGRLRVRSGLSGPSPSGSPPG